MYCSDMLWLSEITGSADSPGLTANSGKFGDRQDQVQTRSIRMRSVEVAHIHCNLAGHNVLGDHPAATNKTVHVRQHELR